MDLKQKIDELNDIRTNIMACEDEFNEVNEKLKVIKERLLQDDEYVEQNEIYKSLRQKHGDLIKEFADKTDQLITNGASDV